MGFDLQGEHARHAYKLLAGVVTPRPIAWVTTLDEAGRVNAAPFSFFNVLLVDPSAYSPIGRMEAPAGYCRTRDRFQMPRPD
jgi:hypothetical protein